MRQYLSKMAVFTVSIGLMLYPTTPPALADDVDTPNLPATVESAATEVSEVLSQSTDTETLQLDAPDENGMIIPSTPSSDIVLPTADSQITIDIPADPESSIELLPTGDATIPGEDEETDLVIQDFTPSEIQDIMTGVRILATIESQEADPLLEFELGLPAGSAPIIHEDGTIEIADNEGNLVGTIGPAWAVDANGTQVPTWYEFEDGKLYQYVDHLAGQYVYPISADPAFLVPLITNGGRILFQRVVAPALLTAGQIAVRQLAKQGIKAAVTNYRSYTRSNARHNLIIATKRNPGNRCEAHHTLPVKFETYFAKRGFTGKDSIHNPKYLVWC